MTEFEHVPDANHHLPIHPGGVQVMVDRAKSRPSRYVYKHVVVMHDRTDVEALPKNAEEFVALIRQTVGEFLARGMPEPYIEVEVGIEPGSYGDGDSAKANLHFASMRDATPEEAESYDRWKRAQEQQAVASRRAHLERELRELNKG